MKKIKAWLQYPWKFPDSPYYKYLVDNPPENIEFLNAKKQKGVITNKRFFWFSNFLKRNIRRLTNKLNLSIPNAHLTKTSQDYDLIHCCHCLSKNKDKPWVADIESIWQLYVGKKTKMGVKKVKKILTNKNCKKIMPWTQTTANDIIKEFPEIKNKVKVVYPAVPLLNIKRKKHEDINLLFVARYFYSKGGLQALKVMEHLTKKYRNVYGTIIGGAPEQIVKKYSANKKIRFFGLLPHKKIMKEIYPNSDIFIYPGFSDSFGFAILEAMSFGLPVISVDRFSRKDLIDNGKIGFIVPLPEITYKMNYVKGVDDGIPQIPGEEKVLDGMIKRTSELIKKPSLLKEMSRNCLKEVKSGKFFIKERNKKLKKIYKEALK